MFKQTLTLTLGLLMTAVSATDFLKLTQTTTTVTAPSWNITYAANLSCGECITGGYVFCMKASEGITIQNNSTALTATCCKDATCA
jgi:hypothetical protein